MDIYGENLDTINKISLNFNDSNSKVSTTDIQTNASATNANVNVVVNKDYFKNGGIEKIEYAYDAGSGLSDYQPVTSSEVIDLSKTVEGYNSHLSKTNSYQLQIEVKHVAVTVDNIDGKLAHINDDGTITIALDINGNNLDALNRVRVYVENGYVTISSNKFQINADGTNLITEVKINPGSYIDKGKKSISVSYETSKNNFSEKEPLITSQNINIQKKLIN